MGDDGGRPHGGEWLDGWASALVDGLPHPVAFLDASLRYRACNPAAQRLLGPPDRVVGRRPVELATAGAALGPEVAAIWEDVFVDVLARGEPASAPVLPVGQGAEQRWFDTMAVPVRGPGPAPRGVVVVHVDATAARAAQEDLRYSESLLARAHEVAGMTSGVLDLRSNRAHLAPTGPKSGASTVVEADSGRFVRASMDLAQDEELVMRVVHPDDRARVLALRDRMFEDPASPAEAECRLVDPVTGIVRHVRFRVAVDRDDDGLPVRVVRTTLDITDLVEVRERLAGTLARQQAVIDVVASLVGVPPAGMAEAVGEALESLGSTFALAWAVAIALDGDRYRMIRSWGAPPGIAAAGVVPNGWDSLLPLAITEPLVLVDEPESGPEVAAQLRDRGLGGLIVAPVALGAEAVGAVALAAPAGQGWRSEDGDLLVLAATAMARALSDAELAHAEQVQRRRLADDIDATLDDIGSDVARLSARLVEAAASLGRQARAGRPADLGAMAPVRLNVATPAASPVADGVGGRPTGTWERLPGVGRMTERELDVLTLLAAGLRVPSIAARLYVSQSTVRNHVSAILRKTGFRSQAELVERLVGEPYA